MPRKKTIEKRENRYPATDVFRYYNANPRNNFVGDCVARAMSACMDTTWADIIREMTEYGIANGRTFNDRKNITSFLKSKGWVKHSEPRDVFNYKIKAKDYLREHHIDKAFVNLGNAHVAAIEDGRILDTWDSSDEIIHTYWTPPVLDVIVLKRW